MKSVIQKIKASNFAGKKKSTALEKGVQKEPTTMLDTIEYWYSLEVQPREEADNEYSPTTERIIPLSFTSSFIDVSEQSTDNDDSISTEGFTPRLKKSLLDDKLMLPNDLFYLCNMENDAGYKLLKQTLKSMENIDCIDNIREPDRKATLMHCAARMNNVECMQVLLENNASTRVEDAIDASPLHYACASGAKDAVIFLLVNNANICAKDRYESFPLSVSVRNGHLDIAKMLVMNGADIHQKEKRGNTCLHIAAKSGCLKRVKFLIEKCNASVFRTNSYGEHVLHVCLQYPAVVQYICDHMENFQALSKLLSRLNLKDKSVIHECCERGYLKSLLIILDSVIKKASNNISGSELKSFLAERLNEYETKRGLAPLHLAAIYGHYRIVDFLLAIKKVDVNKKDMFIQRYSAYNFAIKMGYDHIADMLVRSGSSTEESPGNLSLTNEDLDTLEIFFQSERKRKSRKLNVYPLRSLSKKLSLLM
jgi:ankyrin repeat protein